MSRILIVEDEADLAFGLQDDLKVEGYQVEIARDGETGASRGRQDDWDLILLDIMLPRKDGFEVCRELRRAGVRTPIIMLTAKAQEAEKILGLELGADDYVTKPFSPRECGRGSRPCCGVRRPARRRSAASGMPRWTLPAVNCAGRDRWWKSRRSSSSC